jgi:predicted TPR repeat methyltransferase
MTDQQPDGFARAKASFLDGLACFQAGRLEEAERNYIASLAALPGRASTLINLAATQLRLGRPYDALANADAALRAEADSVDALLHRGTALAQLGRAEEALAAFQRLLSAEPTHAAAWSFSGSLLREMHRPVDAAQAYREALRHGAEPSLNGYYLASVTATDAPPTAPAAYVEALFDGYADDFDAHLVGQLHYDAHRRLVDTLTAAAGGNYRSALDLGCGTGLCGPLVRPMSQRLTGVDLSARMVERARALGVYDRLECADIAAHLQHTDERYDLVLAADVFIYVGDLARVFAAVRRVMASGVFCFSVESLAAGDGAEFRLLPSLRYAHATAYVLRLAAEHGFSPISLVPGPVREEQREAIDGLYVCLRRTGTLSAPPQ